MNTDFPSSQRFSTDCIRENNLAESYGSDSQTATPNNVWIKNIRWHLLFNQLFCWSTFVGGLLALLLMPGQIWGLVGMSLVAIVTPDVNQTVAHFLLTAFGIASLGILWHGITLISNLSPYVSVTAYAGIAVGLLIIGTGFLFLMTISAALMASNGRAKFLNTVCFNHYQTHFILSCTLLLGLGLGYCLVG